MARAEVVLARIVPTVAARPRSPSGGGVATSSSQMASTTKVASLSASGSSEIVTLPEPAPPARSISRSTRAAGAARPAAPDDDLPALAATPASPDAMAPPPAMPIRYHESALPPLTDQSTP